MIFHRPIANPIFTREYRARWRSGLSNVLLFCSALFLAIAAGLVYASASFSARDSTLLRQMAETGHNLFLTLSGMQIGAWLLLGPALTATTIAGERERGLLEMLQLTPLSARRICGGKMLSVWGFVTLLMFAPLPMTALCFLLGGVSPQEFCAALALQFTTALFGLSVGIWASAWSRRATTAMALAFGVVIGWGVLTFFVFIAHQMRSPWVNLGSAGSAWQSFLLDGLWRTNPLFVFIMEAENSRANMSWFSIYTPFRYADWVFCGALQIAISAALLKSATRALWKPLDDESSTRSVKKSRRAQRNEAVSATQSDQIANDIAPVIAQSSTFGIAAFTRFRSGNPVLEREVRRWGRMRRAGIVASRWARIGFALALGGYAIGVAYMLIDPINRGIEMFWFVISVGFLLAACLACALGAVLFTRERESGTWESLQLSLLSPRQVLVGKFAPAWWLCVAFCVVFWLPTLLCVDGVLVSSFARATYLRVPFSQWVWTLLIALGTTWSCLCLGTLMSAFATRIWLSVSWTIGTILFLYIALPLFTILIMNALFNYSSRANDFFITVFRLWHPLFAVVTIIESRSSNRFNTSPIEATAAFLAVTFALGFVMLAFSYRRLKRTFTVS